MSDSWLERIKVDAFKRKDRVIVALCRIAQGTDDYEPLRGTSYEEISKEKARDVLLERFPKYYP